ncbi:hypothetical protein ACJLW7_002507, partial [Vibrio cholerae]
TLLFISGDCISLTLGELFISHSFSLLGGRKNRDYDGSPFYFLVLHLVYESKERQSKAGIFLYRKSARLGRCG